MDKNDLIQLIEQWDNYDQQDTEKSLSGFAVWLLEQSVNNGDRTDSERRIAYLSARLDRHSKARIKDIFHDLALIGYDDFILLNSVFHQPDIPKKVLYKMNLYDMNSGTQVVNRLKREGLLMDSKSEKDKRTSLLRITEKGKQVRHQAFERLGKEVKSKYQLLTDEEITQLLVINKKLEKQYENDNK